MTQDTPEPPQEPPAGEQANKPAKKWSGPRDVTGTPEGGDRTMMFGGLPAPGEDPEWEAMMKDLDPDFPDEAAG